MVEQQSWVEGKLKESKAPLLEILEAIKKVYPPKDVELIERDLERVVGVITFWEQLEDE